MRGFAMSGRIALKMTAGNYSAGIAYGYNSGVAGTMVPETPSPFYGAYVGGSQVLAYILYDTATGGGAGAPELRLDFSRQMSGSPVQASLNYLSVNGVKYMAAAAAIFTPAIDGAATGRWIWSVASCLFVPGNLYDIDISLA